MKFYKLIKLLLLCIGIAFVLSCEDELSTEPEIVNDTYLKSRFDFRINSAKHLFEENKTD